MAETKAEASYEKGKLYSLKVADLKEDPNQPRKYIDSKALGELVKSIKHHGILQPVLFRVDDKKKLVLVSGERRYQAAKKADITSIPAIYTDGNPSEIALVENLLRENLTAIEEAEALQRLKDDHSYTNNQVAGILGKAQNTISEMLSLNNLPQEIRNDCRTDPKVARRVLIQIGRKRTSKGKISAYKGYKKKYLEDTGEEKTPGKGRVGRKKDRVKVANAAFKKWRERLGRIDQKFKPDEKKELKKELQELRKMIDALLG